MSVRVTSAELRQLNAESIILEEKKLEDAELHKRAIIDAVLPALCTTIDDALRDCGEKNLKKCILKITKNLSIIHENCSWYTEYNSTKEIAFVALHDEIAHFREAIKLEYDICTAAGRHQLDCDILLVGFDWSDEDAESASKRARTD